MSAEMPEREGRGSVDPQLIFGVSLCIGLALSWSALSGAMHGEVDILLAGVRLLVAVAFAWAGCYGLSALLVSFANSAPAAHQATPSTPVANERRGALQSADDETA